MLVREPLLSERAKEMGSLGPVKERCDKGMSLSFTLGPKPGMPLNGFAAFVRQQGQQVELFIKTDLQPSSKVTKPIRSFFFSSNHNFLPEVCTAAKQGSP